jgi:hypothetical protein
MAHTAAPAARGRHDAIDLVAHQAMARRAGRGARVGDHAIALAARG